MAHPYAAILYSTRATGRRWGICRRNVIVAIVCQLGAGLLFLLRPGRAGEKIIMGHPRRCAFADDIFSTMER